MVYPNSWDINSDKEEISFENASLALSGIQTTVDSSYFFNEEALITSKLNYK